MTRSQIALLIGAGALTLFAARAVGLAVDLFPHPRDEFTIDRIACFLDPTPGETFEACVDRRIRSQQTR